MFFVKKIRSSTPRTSFQPSPRSLRPSRPLFHRYDVIYPLRKIWTRLSQKQTGHFTHDGGVSAFVTLFWSETVRHFSCVVLPQKGPLLEWIWANVQQWKECNGNRSHHFAVFFMTAFGIVSIFNFVLHFLSNSRDSIGGLFHQRLLYFSFFSVLMFPPLQLFQCHFSSPLKFLRPISHRIPTLNFFP